jgi:hypothetical protein
VVFLVFFGFPDGNQGQEVEVHLRSNIWVVGIIVGALRFFHKVRNSIRIRAGNSCDIWTNSSRDGGMKFHTGPSQNKLQKSLASRTFDPVKILIEKVDTRRIVSYMSDMRENLSLSGHRLICDKIFIKYMVRTTLPLPKNHQDNIHNNGTRDRNWSRDVALPRPGLGNY